MALANRFRSAIFAPAAMFFAVGAASGQEKAQTVSTSGQPAIAAKANKPAIPAVLNKPELAKMLSAVTLFERTPRAVSADGIAQDLSMKNSKLYMGVASDEANAEKMLSHLHKHIIPKMKEAGIEYEIVFQVKEEKGLWMTYFTDGSSAKHSNLAPNGLFDPGAAVKIWMDKHNDGENTVLNDYISMRKEKGLDLIADVGEPAGAR